jgi:dTDP-glucose 4,6-dehydratase
VKILVAGGAGFIGSAFVHRRLDEYPEDTVTVLDKLTYAGRRENLQGLDAARLDFLEGDIADRDVVTQALAGCEAVVNFAAESHVDRSINSPGEFIQTDVFGTYVLLDAARQAGLRYLQVSTDEVYGSIPEGSAREGAPLDPSSPYSASKAGADLLVSAFHHTFGADALILRASNNYGPRQHPEKLIPLSILNALAGDPLPMYGDGQQIRNWLHVDDCCAAIDLALEHGEAGEAYNAAGRDELPNIDVMRRIVELCGRDESLIESVDDRPGHDRRYSLDSAKLEAIGWQPSLSFDQGLERTVAWYRDNERWWAPLRDGEYRAYYERQYGRKLA